MPEKNEGLLVDVANTIGSTIGMVAAKASRFKRLVEAKERVVAKSLTKKARGTGNRFGITKRRKSSTRKVRPMQNVGKHVSRPAASRRKHSSHVA